VAGAGSSDPLAYALFGGKVCFNAGRPDVGYELWCLEAPEE
jgi:hypothetical protein